MSPIRIVVTLGPPNPTPLALRDAGANLARINASHLEPDEMADLARMALDGGFFADDIVIDLQGGKTRIGPLSDPEWVFDGDRVALPVDRPAFLAALRPGDRVRVDDGRVTLRVVAAPDVLEARVEGEGRIEGRKGLALVGRDPGVSPALLDRDRAHVTAAMALGIRTFALSYANAPEQLAEVRAIPSARVIAKIEHPSAFARLDDLAAASDALWLCRGDLGAEVGIARVPVFQRRFLAWTPRTVPIFVAGQVLHHMVGSPRPTRSEACHVADLVLAGVNGLVLSDETVKGPWGPDAVRWIREIEAQATA